MSKHDVDYLDLIERLRLISYKFYKMGIVWSTFDEIDDVKNKLMAIQQKETFIQSLNRHYREFKFQLALSRYKRYRLRGCI
jgi:hypothetical protein